MKKIWIKRFTSLALSLVLLTNSLTPYVLAQEITPSPEPTPTAETTPTPEPTLTATPTPETTPTLTLEVTPEITPEVTPTPLPDTNPVDPNLSTTPSDPTPSPTPSIDLDSPDAQGSAQLTPSLSTDKDDYAPTETVIISGSDYQPNTTYTLVISSQDEPTVRYETTITSTEEGSIYYAYQLDGIYRPNYLVEIFLDSSLVKSITFTDSVSEYPKTICHHNPGNEVTLTFHNAQSYNGHLGTPHNDQTYDTDGPCGDSQPTEEIIVVYHSDLATDLSDVMAKPQSWFFYNDEVEFEGIDNSLGSFVTGPNTPPRGDGSVEISVSGTQRRNLATYQFSGTPLASITTLAYSTYNPSAGNGGSANRVGYLGFNVDFDGSDTWQKRLLFHPTANGTVQQDTWQEWDAINDGDALWSWSGLSGHGGSATQWPDGNTSEYRSINELVAAFPNIRVRVSDPWMGIRVGAPYPDGYTENIDLFKFGTANHTTIWDFEPGQSQPEPVCGNGLVEDGEQCDYSSLNGSSSCSSSCQWVAECRPENIANGEFDIPTVTHSQKWDIFEKEEVLGWTAEWYGGSSSHSGQDRPSPKVEIHAGVNNWAPVDNPYVELDSDWVGPNGSLNNEPASITLSQQVPTIPGYQYTLSWKHSPRPKHNNNHLQVKVNGVEVFNSGVLSGSSSINWVTKTHTFTADSDLTTVSFTELGKADSFGMFLDDVSLECIGLCQEISGQKIDGRSEQGIDGWNIYLTKAISEEIAVPALNAPTISGPVLDSGKQYIILASGTYFAGDTITADAEYSVTSKFSGDTWTDLVTGYESHGDHLLDLELGGVTDPSSWGEHHNSHKYTALVNGNDTAVTFKLNDFYPSNNSGSLTVQAFEVIDTRVTGDGGQYTFGEMCSAETLYVFEENRPLWTRNSPSSGFYPVGQLQTYDFANSMVTGTISGHKWNDTDGDGQRGDEPGLEGWQIIVHPTNQDPYQTITLNTNDSNGEDSLPLTAGHTYLIEAEGTWNNKNGAEHNDADYASNDSWVTHFNYDDDSSRDPRIVDLVIDDQDIDWGSYNQDHLYKTVQEGSGVSKNFKISEAGGPLSWYNDNLGTLTIRIYDVTDQIYTTDQNGFYTATDLEPGEYQVIELNQEGWIQTYPTNPRYHHLTLNSHNELIADFGNQQDIPEIPDSIISGFKYEDTGSGTKILAGWGVQLFGCTALDESTCDSDAGNTITTENGYTFDTLAPGYYLVKEEGRNGWSAHLFSSWFVDLFSQQSAQVNFTNARNSSITACKVEDFDGNLDTDDDRNIVGGWPISLYQNDQLLDTQNTGEDGCYTWTDLDPYQSYKVYEEVGGSGSVALTNPEHTFSSLTPDQDHQHTFVNFRVGNVRGYKYHDINADGAQQFYDEFSNPYEGYLDDWEICLVPHQQSEEQEISLLSASESISEGPNCVLTGTGEWPNGYYEFTHLGPGTYRLYETPHPDWTQTEPSDPNGYIFTVTSGFGIGEGGWYNFGNYSPSGLFLTKSVTRSGDTATFTLTVRNEGVGQVDDVSITDTLPTDFVLNPSSVTLTNPDGSTTNPTTIDLGSNKYSWYIAPAIYHYDSGATPLEIYTLTYEADINGEAGIHTNVAVANGDDPGQSPVFSNYATALLAIASDLDYSAGVSGDQQGDVLGASTSTGQVLGAATGTPSLWSLLGLLFIALGLVLRLPKDRIKKLIATLALALIPLFVTSPVLAEEPKPDTTAPSVHIVDLPTYKNTNSFEISYTALDAGTSGLKDITLEFHREGQSWQNLTTLTSSSGKFMVNSSHITQDDKYYFRSTACDNAGNCASDETSTIIDRELPPAPESFQKAWKDEYAYILKWHNPSSTQSYKVYIYRYHEPVFIAQDASLIAVLDVTPNTDIEWQNSHPEPKPYYYAIRNVDPAGNTSGLVSDPETTATTTSSSQSAPEGTPVTGSESFSGTKLVAAQSGSGQILGEKDSQDGDQDEDGSEVSPDSDAIDQALNQAAPEGGQQSPSIPWRILIIIAVGIILIYVFYIRKK